MLFLRMGPRLLFLRTQSIGEMKDYIVDNLKGQCIDFYNGLDYATEDSTLIFLTDPYHEKTCIDDAKVIILVNEVSSICLVTIINSHMSHKIHRVDLGPACMVMRIAGDEKKVVNRIKQAYNGKSVSWKEGVSIGQKGNTLLALTQQPISGRLSLKENEIVKDLLLIPTPINELNKRLRAEGILYITQSLESGEWYEVRINIYDSKGYYAQHYHRLVFILSQLELGMILGETWTRDHALILYSVLAYQVRLFTLTPPEEIKKLLMALEYDDRGERMVDFDLYYRNKKISWVDLKRGKTRKNKIEECQQYRQELLEKLTAKDRQQLLRMEEEVKKNDS